MANPDTRRHLTDRDVEILTALDRCPLTVNQLLKISQTFPSQPFLSARSVQDRLQKMKGAGWVQSWPYAVVSRGGAPEYYKPTALGFRLLHGDSTPPPTKRHFLELSVGHHHHTHCLADFIAHTLVSAHRRQIHMAAFWRENTLRIPVGDEFVTPDCAFELHTADRRQFNFCVEIDCGTERIRSDKDEDSWQRKIRNYEKVQDRNHPKRFRVLIITTRCSHRLEAILALAREHSENPYRSLFYGVHLDAFLREPDAVIRPCCQDHRKSPASLVPVVPCPLASMAQEPRTQANPSHLPPGPPTALPSVQSALDRRTEESRENSAPLAGAALVPRASRANRSTVPATTPPSPAAQVSTHPNR